MCQCAADGTLDFTKADPQDRRWYTRVSLMISEKSRAQRLFMYDLLHRRNGNLLSRDNLTEESVEKLNQESYRLLQQILQLLFPWNTFESPDQAQESANKRLYDAWVAAWGDPEDPEVQRKIEQTAQWLVDNDASRDQGRKRNGRAAPAGDHGAVGGRANVRSGQRARDAVRPQHSGPPK
jgi:hypothetical protein